MKAFPPLGAALLGCCSPAWAEPPPRSLDQALVETLSLGSANGCGAAFGIPDFAGNQTDLDNFLKAERDGGRLGKEVAAVCGSSAVASAASLGGSLGSLQTTKTVSQFRQVRHRADSRLGARGRRSALDRPLLLAQAGGSLPTTSIDAPGVDVSAEGGPGVFVHIDNEHRDRATTALEAGYKAKVNEALIGFDYALPDRLLAGAWAGYRRGDADYRGAPLVLGGADSGFGASLDPATQAEMCRTGPGGGFDDKGARFGVFLAKRFGDAFADAGIQYSRRNYSYERNVCAIEADSSPIIRNPASVSGFSSQNTPDSSLDDIYAGTIAGKARLTEWGASGRIGFDVEAGPVVWGPRLSLTYLRTSIGAYEESGRTSVTHTVTSNTGILDTARAAGDPTGLELAFDSQRRTSLQSELQLVAAYRHETGFGTLAPRVSVSWQHEFKGERELVGVRLAQDRRAAPTRFTFTTDSVDRNKGTVGLGVSLVRGTGFAADLEVTRLVADDRFDSTSVALQAVWRF